jgi:hypothetical protein
MIVNKNGLIEDIGPAEIMDEKYKNASFEIDIDCRGKSVVPGIYQRKNEKMKRERCVCVRVREKEKMRTRE